MSDKQQLAAMGEHMREMEECSQRITQDARIGGVVFKAGVKVPTVIEAAYRAAEYHNKNHQPNQESINALIDAVRSSASEFKVPDGWRLVPEVLTDEMEEAVYKEMCSPSDWYGFTGGYKAMLAAAPEYKP